MVFYTDTNGAQPFFSSISMIMLGMVMECTPLSEIDLEKFLELATLSEDNDEDDSF